MIDLLTANDRAGEHPRSYYAATAVEAPKSAPLRGETEADVCVIGGGFTGLSAALHLAERGFGVVLLEAHRVGWGASGRNGGQVGSGQRQGQLWLEAHLGRDTARILWDMAEEAKALVRDRIDRHGIDCAPRPGILYAASKPGHVADLHAEAELLSGRYGYDAMEALDSVAVSEALGTSAYHGGILDRGGLHLHPLNLALGLARAASDAGVRIHEGSRVRAIEDGGRVMVLTSEGRVRARQVLIAANGYHCGLRREIGARVMPINNFIVATEPLGEAEARALIRDDVAVADTKFVVNYYRLSEDRRLIFGGGETYGYRYPSDIASLVRKAMLRIYPQLAERAIDYAWGGTLAITVNRLPAFQRLAPNIFSAAGYSGHGVALSQLAGKIMAEAVAGTAERFDMLARLPQPAFPGKGALRAPLLALAMTWYGLRDRI